VRTLSFILIGTIIRLCISIVHQDEPNLASTISCRGRDVLRQTYKVSNTTNTQLVYLTLMSSEGNETRLEGLFQEMT